MIEVHGSHDPTPGMLQACCRALDDKKAEDIRVIFLGDKSSVADYFILASGTSHPHLKALHNTVHATLKEQGATLGGYERDTESGWLVADAYDFVIHLFTPEIRTYYQLERLWRDAEDVTHHYLSVVEARP